MTKNTKPLMLYLFMLACALSVFHQFTQEAKWTQDGIHIGAQLKQELDDSGYPHRKNYYSLAVFCELAEISPTGVTDATYQQTLLNQLLRIDSFVITSAELAGELRLPIVKKLDRTNQITPEAMLLLNYLELADSIETVGLQLLYSLESAKEYELLSSFHLSRSSKDDFYVY